MLSERIICAIINDLTTRKYFTLLLNTLHEEHKLTYMFLNVLMNLQVCDLNVILVISLNKAFSFRCKAACSKKQKRWSVTPRQDNS